MSAVRKELRRVCVASKDKAVSNTKSRLTFFDLSLGRRQCAPESNISRRAGLHQWPAVLALKSARIETRP
jgi:hypothetical protein